MTARLRRAAALALLLGVTTACAGIPDSGPVRRGDLPAVGPSAAPFDFSPPGPETGASPEQVVRGFLVAQQATPSSTTVARAFLSERADERWRPDQGTLLYRDLDVQPPVSAAGGVPVSVRIQLTQAYALDRTGRWLGPRRALEQDGLTWSLVRERGEWRIANPPDALVLPLAQVDSRFRRLSVYFADPTGSIMVPEPIYLPLEVQTPTQLVEALLSGPQGRERRSDRSFIPGGTELQVSVPVTPDGVAQVPLSGELLELDRGDLAVAMAQLVWTLRQLPEVSAVSVSAAGEPVVLPELGVEVPVTAFGQYSPAGVSAPSDLYGLRERAVVRIAEDEESALLRVPRRFAPSTLAVSLLGNPVALADTSGQVQIFARGSEQESGPERALREIATPGVSGLAWDWSRTLWIGPERLRDGVRAVVGDQVRRLDWQGEGSRPVEAFTVSRDGTRVVVALRSGQDSELWEARVTRSPEDSVGPVALSAPRRVRTALPLRRVQELGWRDPQTLAVLVRRDALSSRVLGVPVDGQAVSRVLAEDSDVLFGTAVDLAVSPVDGTTVVRTRGGTMHVMSEQGRWRADSRIPPLRSLTFVG